MNVTHTGWQKKRDPLIRYVTYFKINFLNVSNTKRTMLAAWLLWYLKRSKILMFAGIRPLFVKMSLLFGVTLTTDTSDCHSVICSFDLTETIYCIHIWGIHWGIHWGKSWEIFEKTSVSFTKLWKNNCIFLRTIFPILTKK